MPIPKSKLSNFFKLFKPEYVLGTTYSISFAFFESVVFPSIDRSKLKKCLLLCDKKGFRRATSEAFALRSATRDYMAAPVPCPGSFHPKVWVMIGQERLALLVGSGNLTQTGFIDNYELFEVIELDAGGTGKLLADDVLNFFNGLIGLWPANAQLLAVDTLREMTLALQPICSQLSPNDDCPRLITSFDGSFADSLLGQIGEPDELHLAAPFFGGSLLGIKSLQEKLTPRKMHVFPAIHKNEKVDLPIDEANQLAGVAIGTCKPLTKSKKFSHLKLYGLRKEANQWLFNSSVNCTDAAIAGRNIEAGLLRSVSKNTYREYFPEDYKAGVKATGEIEADYSEANWLTIWATDIGEKIVLTTIDDNRLPLTDVQLEFRSGGSRFSTELSALFENRSEAILGWSLFGEGYRKGNAARVLLLTASDANGNEIHGTAFIDDLAALTSEPKHRGAWRAATALLSLEGIPQYADIASLFSLIEDVAFDDDEDEGTEAIRKLPSGSTRDIIKDKAAIWPPKPIVADVDLLVGGGTRSGHLHWFDRILALLVREQDGSTVAKSLVTDDQDEGVVDVVEEVEPRVIRGCERMWNHAFDEFCRLENVFADMEVDSRQAPRLWGPATFMFLGVMAVRKAVIHGSLDEVETWRATELVRDFAILMFGDRRQGNSYNPSANHVYSDDVFPPLAYDLATRFDVYPHFEIVCILLICMAHLHAASKHSEGVFFLSAWLLFRGISGDNLELALGDSEHLKNVWLRFFDDEHEGLVWGDIAQSLTDLMELNWDRHEGFQILVANRKILADGKFQVTDGSSGICFKSHCSSSGKLNPVNAREFRKLHPVVCDACRELIIPERLYTVYLSQKANNV